MGLCRKFFLAILVIIAAVVLQTYLKLSRPAEIPELDVNFYWGPGGRQKDDTAINKFQIDFSKERLEKLKADLSDTSYLPAPLEGVDFEYGFNTNKLKEVIKYWRTTYLGKWQSERQPHLNKFPQFTTVIQGLKIHFIHVKPKVPVGTKVLPLLLLHGWPGSVVEFYEIIPILTSKTADRDFVFEVIVPSLPGYGFSQAPAKQGHDMTEIAVVLRNLMIRLGLKKFYVQGGDWGSMIGSPMATFFPENVKGYHSNMCTVKSPIATIKWILASFAPKLFVDVDYIDWYYPKDQSLVLNILQETGYMHLQATKPDTIGTVLAHNPIGLAAYILEKFSTWTNKAYRHDPSGGFEKHFKLDSLLDNVMLYYIPNSITSSNRLYKEAFGQMLTRPVDQMPTSVPTACFQSRHDIILLPEISLKEKFKNLVQISHNAKAGHFAAMQVPQDVADDVFEFVKKVEK